MANSTVRKVTLWLALISSVLTFVLGILHLTTTNPSVVWPHDFLDDINQSWRAVFTFRPNKAVDNWTPCVFGAVGFFMQFNGYQLQCCTNSFLPFAIFFFIKGLFADIGYTGGIGILFSIPTWLVTALSLYCWWTNEAPATLALNVADMSPFKK